MADPVNSTMKKTVEYMCKPEKIDSILIYSYGCSYETADIEFEWTRKNARDKGKYLVQYLIQSFAPSEATPEQAHEIGLKLAEEVFGGRYEFVLSTHNDKGDIYNHIIFNDIDLLITNTVISIKSGITKHEK